MPEEDVRHTVAAALAKARRVERLVEKITGRPLDADTKDLSQIIYTYILEYAPDKIADLWENGQMDYFLIRVIRNQYYGEKSRYYRQIRSFRTKTVVILPEKDENDETEE